MSNEDSNPRSTRTFTRIIPADASAIIITQTDDNQVALQIVPPKDYEPPQNPADNPATLMQAYLMFEMATRGASMLEALAEHSDFWENDPDEDMPEDAEEDLSSENIDFFGEG